MRAPLRTITLLLILLTTFRLPARESVFYFHVAPDGSDTANGLSRDEAFASIDQARRAAGDLIRNSSDLRAVHVLIYDGVYELSEPVTFTPEDSGPAGGRLIFKAAPESRPVITGGREITGWEEGDDGVWSTRIETVAQGEWYFNQIYVNGELRHRARTPNEGFYRVAGFPDGGSEIHYHTDCQRFEYYPGDLRSDWTNQEDVEVIVYHFWTDSHLPIKSLDTENNIVTFQHKAGKVFTDDFSSTGARYIVENVYEALDEPGEWYLNRQTGRLSYLPKPGENMETAKVIAPLAPALIRMKGDPVKQEFVENITFYGLTFQHTLFTLPKGNSNDRQGSASVPAAIAMTGARECVFEHCEISNLGTFAFELEEGCSGNRFHANHLHHLGAGGFRVNGGDHNSHPLTRTRDNTISHNIIEYYGEVYPSAVGVLLQHTSGARVIHNEIHHGWYTGVSVGWVWGYGPSVSRDNIVSHNHIHHIGQGLLSDMGAVYTLGVSPGTVIANNHIHHVESNHYGGWGIYNDEGSTHHLIENNIVHDTKFAGYNIHFCKEVTVRNNIFAFARLEQLSRTRVDPHISVFFENNIVYWTEGELLAKNWKDKPYEFYFHSKNDSGRKEVTSTFEMDYNIYYNPEKKAAEVDFNGQSLEEWREMGKDRHSLYTDPLFVDPEKRDFRLQEGSPAPALGFRPIDMSEIGPQVKVGVE